MYFEMYRVLVMTQADFNPIVSRVPRNVTKGLFSLTFGSRNKTDIMYGND